MVLEKNSCRFIIQVTTQSFCEITRNGRYEKYVENWLDLAEPICMLSQVLVRILSICQICNTLRDSGSVILFVIHKYCSQCDRTWRILLSNELQVACIVLILSRSPYLFWPLLEPSIFHCSFLTIILPSMSQHLSMSQQLSNGHAAV